MHVLHFTYRNLFIFAAISLTAVGVLFVHSAAAYWGQIRYADTAPFAFKQLIYIGVSITVAYFMMRTPHLSNGKFWTVFYVAAVVMLAAVLVPGIGAVRNGSQSWIALGPVSIQPAEFVKVALIGKLAMGMKQKPGRRIWDWRHFALILLPFALIMMQPDLGSAVIMIVAAFVVLFAAGYPLSFFAFLGFAGAGSFAALILAAPYRLDRIKSYIDPWSDPLGKGFQGIQSLFAIAPGGLLGHGFGNSRQKYLYLPEPQNDFIFSIIAEETGFLGAAAVLALFVCLLIGGFGIAVRTTGWRECLVVSGMVSIIIFQTFLNVGVVSGLLPVTGVTLPFISYGGSSMLTTWLAVGTILHFSRRTTD
ncbi:stage V sporulation protein E [Sporosarcina sp. NCCP-2716]|uniref:putative lipid II flippase FtsW n=1 Tax=Sporosarcina sp. NCCP-2716 TaxID=2943679 RepID=UPI0020409010|nr:putative lipid II flippase FtsW [Sporosarcina sp. NCCP-2716]GKV67716.1 stage V sporulation protein E [Sporosarcina sp. NCCP-2716]